MRVKFIALATAAGLLASPALSQQDVHLPADEVLVPWHAALADEVGLPVAPPTPALPSSTTLTRIAFGSCNQQDRSQHMWARIAASDPQAFLFIGDNVYGDTNWDGGADLGTLRAAYAKQTSHPEFAEFRATIPMLATWDDHDFGFNDGGATFSYRRFAEEIFETYWDSPEDVRGRDGVHFSRFYGEAGRQVQLIMLDTRFFRSNLKRPGPGEKGPSIGRYLPQQDAGATMLGDVQWEWLRQELAKPADLRIVVSSVQVLTEAHGWESWAVMPYERAKLLDMLGARAGGGLVLLSGDRHSGGIYQAKQQEQGEQFWEITSSSLNLAFSSTEEATAREPDPSRVTPFIGEENFGLVDIDWQSREVTMSLLGNQGEMRASQTIAF